MLISLNWYNYGIFSKNNVTSLCIIIIQVQEQPAIIQTVTAAGRSTILATKTNDYITKFVSLNAVTRILRASLTRNSVFVDAL